MNWIFAIFSIITGLVSLKIVFGFPHFFHDWKYSIPKKLKLSNRVLTSGGIEKISFDEMIMRKRKCRYCGRVEYNMYDVQKLKDNWQICSSKTHNEYWSQAYDE